MRGRKPQPKAGGVRATDSGFPPAPRSLSIGARSEWKRIGAQMGDQLLTRLDEATLEAYCEARVRVRKLGRQVAKMKSLIVVSESGNEMVSLVVSSLTKQEAHLVKLAGELGLTPIARTRLAAESSADEKEETLEDLISKAPSPMRIAK